MIDGAVPTNQHGTIPVDACSSLPAFWTMLRILFSYILELHVSSPLALKLDLVGMAYLVVAAVCGLSYDQAKRMHLRARNARSASIDTQRDLRRADLLFTATDFIFTKFTFIACLLGLVHIYFFIVKRDCIAILSFALQLVTLQAATQAKDKELFPQSMTSYCPCRTPEELAVWRREQDLLQNGASVFDILRETDFRPDFVKAQDACLKEDP
ncbi:hypothetical protein IAU60_003624 [Kwoniella sp. DSM 27419]